MLRTRTVGIIAGLFALLLASAPLRAQQAAKEKPEDLNAPPLVSAAAWAIADGKTGKLLWGGNETTRRAMASTTKIMTALLVLELAAAEAKILDEVVVVSEKAAKTGGSTAKIEAGDRYPVRDLLYGLLLPSGNDAATALAEHFGKRFIDKDKEGDAQAAFIAEMNRRAQKLEMAETKYFDPHGLGANHSCARDLTILAHAAFKNTLFARYVQTRRHTCEATNAKDEKRPMEWTNTNKLLGIEGYDGIKTGTTGAAGSCLVSSGRRGDDHLLIVVLGATTNDNRYIDSRNLYRWAWRQRGHK